MLLFNYTNIKILIGLSYQAVLQVEKALLFLTVDEDEAKIIHVKREKIIYSQYGKDY